MEIEASIGTKHNFNILMHESRFKIKNYLFADVNVNCARFNKKNLVGQVDQILDNTVKILIDQVDRILG